MIVIEQAYIIFNLLQSDYIVAYLGVYVLEQLK